MRPLRSPSAASMEVMRNPLSTKNIWMAIQDPGQVWKFEW